MLFGILIIRTYKISFVHIVHRYSLKCWCYFDNLSLLAVLCKLVGLLWGGQVGERGNSESLLQEQIDDGAENHKSAIASEVYALWSLLPLCFHKRGVYKFTSNLLYIHWILTKYVFNLYCDLRSSDTFKKVECPTRHSPDSTSRCLFGYISKHIVLFFLKKNLNSDRFHKLGEHVFGA